MRILFLDDNPDRHKAFKKRAIGFVVDYAWNADEAIELLKTNEYELIMLDHDLGGPEEEGQLLDDAKDGRHVARFIAANHPKHVEATFVVHSLNENGASAMVWILKKHQFTAHRLPFAWRMIEKTEAGCTFRHDGTEPKPCEIDMGLASDEDQPE